MGANVFVSMGPMDVEAIFGNLLAEARHVYEGHAALVGFQPFPDDVTWQDVHPLHLPCAKWLESERGLSSPLYTPLQEAIVAAAPHARWRETYKGTGIGDEFLSRFGCYAIIGPGGPFTSDKLRLWIVYMPVHLYYPWHHHPGEEMYMVISGYGVFRRKGAPDRVLGPGETCFHATSQSHALETRDAPILCLVAWRNGFDTPPVLS